MNPTTTPDPADGSTEATTTPPATPDKRGRSRGRLISLVLGSVLIVAGVSVLGYVAWQYWGTDIISKRKQAELRDELEARWEYPTVVDVLGPASVGSKLGSSEALIRIPAFGKGYEVPMIEGVRDSDLAKGIGHFPGTGPGQVGNFALAAHRVTHGEPFRNMPDLRPGDQVIVETADATYTYELDTDPNDLNIPFTQNWVLDPMPTPPEGQAAPPGMPTFDTPHPTEAIITLTTCSELFHTDDRLVAFGHLVATTPK